jgi:heme a synthase
MAIRSWSSVTGVTDMGRLETGRQRAIHIDTAELGPHSDAGSFARRIRGISQWTSKQTLIVLGVLVAVAAIGSTISRKGAAVDDPLRQYGGSTINTLAIMGLAFVVVGRWLRVSPKTFRRVAFASAVLLGFIILTGAAVRLTGSGLGCEDWPTCNDGKVVPALDDYHGKVEFGNRIVTGLCVLAAGVGVLTSLVRRPYRRDLVQIGGVVVVAIMGNAIVGGLTVLNKLQPEYVMSHFLLAIAALAAGLLLFHRAGEDGASADLLGRDRQAVLGTAGLHLGRAMTVSAFLTLLLGTIVTGSGPHGGDPDVDRFGIQMTTAAKIHSLMAWATLALVLVLARSALRIGGHGADRLRRRFGVLLLVTVAQGGIGYAQWFTQVPAALVMMHIVGAVCFWSAVLWVRAALSVPGVVGGSVRKQAGEHYGVPAATV